MKLSEFKIWFDGFLDVLPESASRWGLSAHQWEDLKITLLNLTGDEMMGDFPLSSTKTNPNPQKI